MEENQDLQLQFCSCLVQVCSLFFGFDKCALASAFLLHTENQKDYFYPEIKINHEFYSRFHSPLHKET